MVPFGSYVRYQVISAFKGFAQVTLWRRLSIGNPADLNREPSHGWRFTLRTISNVLICACLKRLTITAYYGDHGWHTANDLEARGPRLQ